MKNEYGFDLDEECFVNVYDVFEEIKTYKDYFSRICFQDLRSRKDYIYLRKDFENCNCICESGDYYIELLDFKNLGLPYSIIDFGNCKNFMLNFKNNNKRIVVTRVIAKSKKLQKLINNGFEQIPIEYLNSDCSEIKDKFIYTNGFLHCIKYNQKFKKIIIWYLFDHH